MTEGSVGEGAEGPLCFLRFKELRRGCRGSRSLSPVGEGPQPSAVLEGAAVAAGRPSLGTGAGGVGRTMGLRASTAKRLWRNSVCPVIQRINTHTSVPISTPCQETKFTSPPFIRCWEGTPPAHGGFGPSDPGTDPPIGTQWLSLGPKAKQKGLRRLPPSQGSSRLQESGSPLSPLSTRR